LFFDILPQLRAPPGVRLVSNGGGSAGSERASSEATAFTDQGAGELEAYFADQLAAAGWTRFDGGTDGPLAWSTWRLPREGDWQGLLFVLESAEGRRDLYLRAGTLAASANPATYYFGPAQIVAPFSGNGTDTTPAPGGP